MSTDANALIIAAEARHRQHMGLPLAPVGDSVTVVAACYRCWAEILNEALDRRSK